MSEDVNQNRKQTDESPAVIGPAVVNPDHKNAHLEDTLSFFLPSNDTKSSADETPRKESALHIPPAVLPNGETVNSSRPTGTLSIPPAVLPQNNGDDPKNGSVSSYQPGSLFTSPFGPAGKEGSRSLRAGSAKNENTGSVLNIPKAKVDQTSVFEALGSTDTKKDDSSGDFFNTPAVKKPENTDSLLNIPAAKLDHTSVFHSYGYDAENIPEDLGVLHSADASHITARESQLLADEIRESSTKTLRDLPSTSIKSEFFKDDDPTKGTETKPQREKLTRRRSSSPRHAAPSSEPVSEPKPAVVNEPKPAVVIEPKTDSREELGETLILPVVNEAVTNARTPEARSAPAKTETPAPRSSSTSRRSASDVPPKNPTPPSSKGGSPSSPGKPDPAEEKKLKKQAKRRKRLIFFTWILVFFVIIEMAVGGTGLYVINQMVREAPNLSLTDFVGEESSKIYDDNGQLVTEVGVYLRENITYDKCPEALVDAFLSVEDSRFFSHFGFDVPRFTKAAIDNLKSHSFGQGGSTFTMQLVKNTYFSIESMDAENTGQERTKSIEYKVQQIYLAIKLETLLSKKEIFQLYLNKLNFGGNIRGVQRAAQYYFGKNCNELNLSESAMLAGIVNLPNRYNPYEYLDYGTTRRNEVLNLMNYHGYLTEDELKLAKAIRVEDTLAGEHRKVTEDSQYQSYLDVVLEEAMALTGCDPTVKGMKIYTHLNRAMQETVEAIQNEETNVIYPDELMQVAMISMDNRTGAVIAIGGGRNYDGARLLNRATMNYKQPGSSVKPLLSYGLAFEYLGYTIDEVLLDKPITYPQESMVLVNANGQYNGDVTIKDAVGNSLNIPAIITLERVVNKIGNQKVVDYLQKIGFSRVKPEYFHLSYAIGGTTFETTCKELAGAHSMLINGGVYNQPHTIQKIVLTADGSEFYPENLNVRALSSGSAYLACMLEENNVSGPYFNWMQILKRDYPVYAKTGTTDWGNDGVQYGIPKGQMKDKWMVASTSQYTNCVWVGYDMAVAGKETYYTSYKSNLNIPGNINKILLDKEEELYGVPEAIQQPNDIEEVSYVYGSFPHVRPEYAADGGGVRTSLASRAGLESMPLVSTKEYLEYANEEAKLIGASGMGARYDQNNVLTVSWGNAGGACAGGQKDISLHDAWNNITMWGACLADLSWLSGGGGSFWGTVYCDDVPVGEFSSENGFFNGYVADLYGTVKVCGGSSGTEGNGSSACTVATYVYDENASGYVDEFGNWVPVNDYSQYGHWDDQGNWIGEGWWDENGFHH